jgi:hypothetical protein
MRITNSGAYESCRWQSQSSISVNAGIQTVSPLTYFQKNMSALRTDLLDGVAPKMCNDCRVMEQHGKVSGRQRQLLKIGVQEQYFEKSLASSPLKKDFDYSHNNQGSTLRTITDWQIDLGNHCNGACVFCLPESSSTLANEFKKIGLIEQLPPMSWCNDPVLLQRFIDDLLASPKLQYLHFIGGETVITPGFKKILSALVDAGIAKNISIGFTTNLSVWSNSINALLVQFKQVNLGMSVETLTSVDDYVRYPSQLSNVKQILDKWLDLGNQHQWLMQIRITPTCLTIHDLDTVYDYAWQNNIAVESCNFIDKPGYLRSNILPKNYRDIAIQKLSQWVHQHQTNLSTQIINTRDPNIARAQIVQDAESYLNYLDSAEDESHRLPDLVAYLKRLEASRGNSILTYLPQYEELFRSAGY